MTAPTTGLNHLPESQPNETLLQSFSNSWSFGPITVNAAIDLSAERVTVSATVLGTSIGSVTLDPSNTTATIGGSVGGFKAEVDITMDFNDLNLTIKAEVCAPIVGCKSSSTTLHL